MNRARDLELKDETIRFRPLFPYGNADATAVADGTAIEIGGAVVSSSMMGIAALFRPDCAAVAAARLPADVAGMEGHGRERSG